MFIRGKHLAAAGSAQLAGSGGARLWSVNVNKAAAGATLTLYDGTDNTGSVIAILDCGTLGSYLYGLTLSKGLYYTLAGGSPDLTIGYE